MPVPQSPFRVLVVDDSSVVRRVLADLISSDPQLKVAGTASEGRTALRLIAEIKPDLVVLDVEMPEMDGLTALSELRKHDRHLPVIMFSTLTHRGAAATLDALSLGADDYVPKERNTLGLAASIDDLRRELLPKIHALCFRSLRRQGKIHSDPAPVAPPVLPRPPQGRIAVVAIGVSTGGPDALCKILPELPADFPVPIAMVQHMPAVFTKLLAERLTAKSHLPVREAAGGETLKPGTIWLAPGGKHLRVVAGPSGVILELDESPPRNYCRPSVDILMESAARTYQAGTLAVILTGMGSDGLDACELVRKSGGQIIAQDEESSVVWGMPGAIVRAGLADAVLPVQQIAREIMQRTMNCRNKIQLWNTPAGFRESAYVQHDE